MLGSSWNTFCSSAQARRSTHSCSGSMDSKTVTSAVSTSGCAMLFCAKFRKISSNSLKFLTFTFCGFNQDRRFRTLIYTPSLVSLRLEDHVFQDGHLYRTSVLDNMPALEKAFVRLANENADCCTHADSGNCGHENCNSCYGGNCVLLKGLSEAENLTLIAISKMFIFKRDLKQCLTFSKLRL
ncbi:hypothetical protein PVAP13_7NG349317 [Panicum virgatum]|uniref:Uncharacterized protein n=1 Tax=Panicum virgatum TaxID=38727 RepID=A0A8T0PU07_PANVG|nr:hypothetical protein PVAP13_7NG349317 [Panicum virgatum]